MGDLDGVPGEDGAPYPLPSGFDGTLRNAVDTIARDELATGIDNHAWALLGQIVGQFCFQRGLLTAKETEWLDVLAKKAGALLQALEGAKRASLSAIIDRELKLRDFSADITSLEAVLRALYELPSYSAYNAEVLIKTAGAAKTVDRDEVELIQGLRAWWG